MRPRTPCATSPFETPALLSEVSHEGVLVRLGLFNTFLVLSYPSSLYDDGFLWQYVFLVNRASSLLCGLRVMGLSRLTRRSVNFQADALNLRAAIFSQSPPERIRATYGCSSLMTPQWTTGYPSAVGHAPFPTRAAKSNLLRFVHRFSEAGSFPFPQNGFSPPTPPGKGGQVYFWLRRILGLRIPLMAVVTRSFIFFIYFLTPPSFSFRLRSDPFRQKAFLPVLG